MENEASGTGSLRDWRTQRRLNLNELDNPAHYGVFDPHLKAAVDTSLTLGMPLLLTGEPGVGKSSLAAWVAQELNVASPLVYRVKSDTKGQDLLFEVDYLARMADAQLDDQSKDRARQLLPYVRFNALGLAILRTWSRVDLETHNLLDKVWPESSADVEGRPSVVLIDEIDKAPSDVPNDLLEELRKLSFLVPGLSETNVEYGVSGPAERATGDICESEKLRPVVIITSNAARSLPAPFLRRCVYYHMHFPDPGSDTYKALQSRLNSNVESVVGKGYSAMLANKAVFAFEVLRAAGLKQSPSTAELLSLMCRAQSGEFVEGALSYDAKEKWLETVLSLLVKRIDDKELARKRLESALEP